MGIKKGIKRGILIGLVGISFLWGFDLKSNRVNVGIRVGDFNQNHKNYLYGGLKLGYYFMLMPNKYRISNEVFIDGAQVVGNKYATMVDVGINWLTNLARPFDFFMGVRTGIIRRGDKNGHTWGVQGGLLYKVNKKEILEAGVSWDNIYDNPDPTNWGSSIVRSWVGVNFYGF